ncbi:leucine-rich repeat domain-containing protein, partial [Bacteroidales bacterium OttesenSCG-928-C19]|nr:leucine-rich repeat domain-containing protein [Bacteroidales bacterium OttesenSCG-928-C19]
MNEDGSRAQRMEKLLFEGKEYQMATEPLSQYLQTRSDIKFNHSLPELYRGYIGKWEVREGELFLIEFEEAYIEWYIYVDLKYVFPDKDEVFASWFTGIVRIPMGDMLKYVPRGYDSIYEMDMILTFKKGILIDKHTIFNSGGENKCMKEVIEIYVCPSDELYICFLIICNKATIDWGDGATETIILDGAEQLCSHKYTQNREFVTIQIEAEFVTFIGISKIGIFCELKTINDCPHLKEINCNSTDLLFLITKTAANLEKIDCSECSISDLDLSENPHLQVLNCSNTQIRRLSLEKNTELRELYCGGNKIAKLDLSKNINLEVLFCNSNSLRDIDLKGLVKLKKIRCSYNKLNSLNVQKNTELEHLDCSYCNLTHLNLNNNPKMIELNCSENNLKELDLSNNTELEHVSCYNNSFNKEALIQMLNTFNGMDKRDRPSIFKLFYNDVEDEVFWKEYQAL